MTCDRKPTLMKQLLLFQRTSKAPIFSSIDFESISWDNANPISHWQPLDIWSTYHITEG